MAKQHRHYYFAGIGGSGMSALAQILRGRGCQVSGSDRSYDRGGNRQLFTKLLRQGIRLVQQDGRSITADIDCLVVSTAIEESNAELQQARKLSLTVIHRAELLAALFNADRGIGIAGTSGKSTVTGMVAAILDAHRTPPTVVNGGVIPHYASRCLTGNARAGSGGMMVAEVDESDGSIRHFRPEVGLITNISKDHKPLPELHRLFQHFIRQTSGAVVLNADCPESARLKAPPGAIRFGISQPADISATGIAGCPDGMRFHVSGIPFMIRLPGRHNVANALAAIAVATALQVPAKAQQAGLRRFRGIRRRLEPVGSTDSIAVFDDFAHNPDKLRASINALRPMAQRSVILFQPHGYGPTRFMLTELAEAFSAAMRRRDILIGLPIFDAGGTADRSIATADLLQQVNGPRTIDAADRADALARIKSLARSGDVIAVMGARDDSLSMFARKILKALREQNK